MKKANILGFMLLFSLAAFGSEDLKTPGCCERFKSGVGNVQNYTKVMFYLTLRDPFAVR